MISTMKIPARTTQISADSISKITQTRLYIQKSSRSANFRPAAVRRSYFEFIKKSRRKREQRAESNLFMYKTLAQEPRDPKVYILHGSETSGREQVMQKSPPPPPQRAILSLPLDAELYSLQRLQFVYTIVLHGRIRSRLWHVSLSCVLVFFWEGSVGLGKSAAVHVGGR